MSKTYFNLFCSDIPVGEYGKPECCVSCHSEWEDGYGELEGIVHPSAAVILHCCCSHTDWWKSLSLDAVSELLLKYGL